MLERRYKSRVVIALIIIALAVGGYYLLDKSLQDLPDKNVILIVIDTVRVDRLGCYGSTADMTPQIDRFARSAVRFEQAFSHAPWTLPSVASLFTSQYPAQHGAGGNLDVFTALRDDAVTIAEVFKRTGAMTGAITNVLFLTEKFGMTQGFRTVDATLPDNNILSRRAGATTEAALHWLDRHNSKPFFLFIHYFDPHLRYDPPQPFRKRFADARDADSDGYIFGSVGDMMNLRKGLIRLDSGKIARLEKLHNGEVAYTDAEVGRLLAGVSERNLAANTVIIITSDHGEEFYDHKGFEHGHTLYDELLHVPLIIRAPGVEFMQANTDMLQERELSVSTTVRQIDIAPTLCELVGIKPAPSFEGKSLVPFLRGHKGEDRPVLSQGNMWGPGGSSWRKGGYKLIRHSSTEPLQLFDINSDMREQNNIADKIPLKCKAMMTDLDLILQAITLRHIPNQVPALSQREIERLRSLGYVK